MRTWGRKAFEERGEWAWAVERPSDAGARPAVALSASPESRTKLDQISFITGVTASGEVTQDSYWGWAGTTAAKFGTSIAGTGATISYAYEAVSSFSAAERATFERALTLWSAVADIRFVPGSAADADILLKRGYDGTSYTTAAVAPGAGVELGHHTGQTVISIDTRVFGGDLSGNLDFEGGLGFGGIVHEVGHALGLGHGGAYNFTVEPTDQYSRYDNVAYSTMSYFSWADNLIYAPDSTYYWGTTSDGVQRVVPQTLMPLDILAIQRLYGQATSGPLSGGNWFGFNSNITGPLGQIFDFDRNYRPALTIYSSGTGNTIDFSKSFYGAINLNLYPGSVSNLFGQGTITIADGTIIETAYGTSYNDVIVGNGESNWLYGLDGFDKLTGGPGDDYLFGGGDNDVYLGWQLGDQIFEELNGGYDIVYVDSPIFYFTENIDQMNASPGGTHAFGDDVANRMVGGRGVDIFVGGAGDDVLNGDAGNDVLNGGPGKDTLAGGGGDDTIFVTEAGELVSEYRGGGTDTIVTVLDYILPANFENLTLRSIARFGMGNTLDNRIEGFFGDDRLIGLDGADELYGMGGSDLLEGGKGADVLRGGKGADTLTGGTQADRFVFADREFGKNLAGADLITDFTRRQGDVIDLSAVSVGRNATGAFAFIGEGAFGKHAGEVRYERVEGETHVFADLDGDGKADLAIRLLGKTTLFAEDFVF